MIASTIADYVSRRLRRGTNLDNDAADADLDESTVVSSKARQRGNGKPRTAPLVTGVAVEDGQGLANLPPSRQRAKRGPKQHLPQDRAWAAAQTNHAVVPTASLTAAGGEDLLLPGALGSSLPGHEGSTVGPGGCGQGQGTSGGAGQGRESIRDNDSEVVIVHPLLPTSRPRQEVRVNPPPPLPRLSRSNNICIDLMDDSDSGGDLGGGASGPQIAAQKSDPRPVLISPAAVPLAERLQRRIAAQQLMQNQLHPSDLVDLCSTGKRDPSPLVRRQQQRLASAALVLGGGTGQEALIPDDRLDIRLGGGGGPWSPPWQASTAAAAAMLFADLTLGDTSTSSAVSSPSTSAPSPAPSAKGTRSSGRLGRIANGPDAPPAASGTITAAINPLVLPSETVALARKRGRSAKKSASANGDLLSGGWMPGIGGGGMDVGTAIVAGVPRGCDASTTVGGLLAWGSLRAPCQRAAHGMIDDDPVGGGSEDLSSTPLPLRRRIEERRHHLVAVVAADAASPALVPPGSSGGEGGSPAAVNDAGDTWGSPIGPDHRTNSCDIIDLLSDLD